MKNCNFNVVRERDMDLLFAEAFSTDKGFLSFVLAEGKTGLDPEQYEVNSVELSKADQNGESDITVILNDGSEKMGLLIEDKIDAPAMKEQYRRYTLRARKGMQQGAYSDYRILLFCPEKYYETNSEAKKYVHLSYESIKDYFSRQTDPVSAFRCQQLAQAITRAKKPPEVIRNEKAVIFFRKYIQFVHENYPALDIRTKAGSNGWWVRFGTVLDHAIIYHKITFDSVDFTIHAPDEQSARLLAELLSHQLMKGVTCEFAKKSVALKLSVPHINNLDDFENVDINNLRSCLDEVQAFSDLAGILAIGRDVMK